MSFFRATATIAVLTFISRIAGFARDILMARFLGAGILADAFFVALKLPNFFRRITAEGALSIAFIPIFSETLEKDGKDRAGQYASNVLSLLFFILMPFTILVLALMPWIVALIAPGFEIGGERYEKAIELSRITFPYLLLMSMTALIGGILNASDRFAPFAAAPILFNFCLITGLLFHGMFDQDVAQTLSIAVLISGLVQLVWVWFFLKKTGLKIRIKLPEFSDRIRRTYKLMIPAILGAGVMHVNLFVDIMLASMLPTGSISYLYYADRLAQLPLGVIGIAIGTALLPMMSKSIASNDVDHSRNLFQNALLYGFLFSVPASFALIVMSYPVMYTLFVHGEFSLIDGYVAAQVLTAYAVGMPAYIASKTYSTVFYAHQDTKTPLIIASISACCNIVLSLSLINFYGVWGIALATALAGWIQLILLYWRACKKDVCQFSKPIGVRLIKVVFASFFMAISVHLISDNVFEWVELNVLTRIVYLSVAVLSGLIIYSGLIMLLKVVALHDLKLIFGRKKHDHLSH